MEEYLRPERFNANPNTPTASKEWKYWLRTLQNSLNSNSNNTGSIGKLNSRTNLVSQALHEHIADFTTYDEAISKLNEVYIHSGNEIFARHKLATRRQNPGVSIDEFT